MELHHPPASEKIVAVIFAGPLTTSFAAAVGANAQQSEAAKALIKFLTAPSAAPVFRAKGLDPAG
jgi:ABC-type molybdate transport system substrate-binding protein